MYNVAKNYLKYIKILVYSFRTRVKNIRFEVRLSDWFRFSVSTLHDVSRNLLSNWEVVSFSKCPDTTKGA